MSYEGFELQCTTCGHHAHRSANCPRLQFSMQDAQVLLHNQQRPANSPPSRQQGPNQREPSIVMRSNQPPARPRGHVGHAGHDRSPAPHRRNRRRGGRYYQRPVPVQGPDDEGFTPVQHRRRRPSLWDVRLAPLPMANPMQQTQPVTYPPPMAQPRQDTIMLEATPAQDPKPRESPGPSNTRPRRPSRWDVRPQSPDLILPDIHSREFVTSHLEPIVELFEISDPVTIPSQPMSPYSWSSDPGITSSRLGNHHSNGDSRSTPEYESNGWEKVPRDKLPRKTTWYLTFI